MRSAGAWRARPVLMVVAPLLVTLAAAGCAAGAPAPDPAAAPPTPFSVPPPVTVTMPTPTVVIATDGPRTWTMPNLVGENLQVAQDTIQQLTGFEVPITTSHDATGGGRQQLLDRNWQVCSQSVPPGSPISGSTRVDFGTVRTDERCNDG